MQISLTVVDPRRAEQQRDLVLDVVADTSVTDVRPLLLEAIGVADDGAQLFVDGRPLDDHLALGTPPLVDGAVVVIGRPGAAAGRASGHIGGFLQLHVVGGPDAGRVHVLGPGLHRIGRAGLAEVPLDDPDVSRFHAELVLDADGVSVRDTHSTNGSRVDGVSVGPERATLAEGSRLQVGASTLVLRRPDPVTATTSPTGLGTVDVNRPPRILPPDSEVVVRLPAPPEEPPPARVPLLAMILPVAVAVPLAFIWSPYALVFAVMSPVMLLGSLFSDRRSRRREHRQALEGYAASRTAAEVSLAAALTEELAARRDESPDAAALVSIAVGPSRRIWERRRSDPDVLDLRIGTARRPARVQVVAPDSSADAPGRPALDDAPVTVSLAEIGVLGIAGPRHRARALARSLVGQVATLHSPRDVACAVLVDGSGHDEWAWTTWLPHCRPGAGGGVEPPGACRALIGTDPEQVRRRVAALDALVTSRRDGGRPDRTWHGPRVVVVLDGAGRLRTVAGLARLLEHGPVVGVTFICLDTDLAALPAECRGTVELGGEVGTRAVVRVTGEPPVPDVVADLTGPGWAVRLARAMAPLRDATPTEVGHDLPEQVRLREVLGPAAVNPDEIARRWVGTPRSTKAVLGVTPTGPMVVDLRVDGPHALVAGTTGSGKSELLRTLVTSLALGNRPDEMVFVLVDYKGGAAFAECARLPHTVGLVTDLDQHLTRRALVSLQAELRRREGVLRRQGATDLDEYQALADADPDLERVPRLVLVVDEFRVLAEELPDFVSGLVRVAAVGRSLGLHLVLATQRPAGVVTADMRANVNLRIALRVRDTLDSTDVVDAGDATGISERTPGRAFLRAGGNPLVAVQTAHVSGPALRAGPGSPTVRCISTTTMGAPLDRAASPLSDNGSSDLFAFVGALRSAAERVHAAPVPSPWLPPLPEVVTADQLPADTEGSRVTYGLVDLPHLQRREGLTWDLADDGCLAVVGTSRSGRTSTLRSLVAALTVRRSPAGVGVYVLDGGGALGDLAPLAHVGAVVPRDDADRTARVLRLLLGEVARRASLPAGAPPEPHLVLVVDGWESLRSVHNDLDGGGLDPVLQLAREGPAVGVLTVVAGDRSVLMGASGAAFPERLVLRTGEPTDAVLAGVPPADAGGRLPPGRGFRVGSAGVREVHVALLQPTSTSSEGPLPQRVPPMPTRLRLAELPPPRSGDRLVLGVGGDFVGPLDLDPEDDGPCVLVAGHPRSGRSTTLLTLAAASIRSGRALVVLAPRRSPLSELAGDRVLGRFGAHDGEAVRNCLEGARRTGTPVAVLVDDAEMVDGTPVEPVLLDVLARAETTGELCLIAGSSPDLVSRFAGLTVEARKRGVGVLLGPASPLDGDLFGVRVPRRPERRPGRGLLVRRGEMVPVQVALTVGEDCR